MSESPKQEPTRSSGKISNGLASASFAAVLAVYAAGYVRTQSAASRFSSQVEGRKPPARQTLPAPPTAEVAVAAPPAPILPAAPARDAEPKVGSALPAKPVTPAKHAPAVHPETQPAGTPASAQSSAALPPPEAAPVVNQPAEPPVPAPVAETKPAPAKPAPLVWKDGAYKGWGYSRHGDIEAEVTIEGGNIASATISQCRTRYSCSVIDKLPPEVAQRQSPDVDFVSGATQSADAFYQAVVAALELAKAK